MRFRIDLAYHGGAFHGWAKQPGLRTVQGEIEVAIATVMRFDTPVTLTVAGRTDTGVHARGQVAHVDIDELDPVVLTRRLRRFLPADISIRAVTAAPEGFNARFSAIERRYVYRLCDGVPDPLVRSSVVATNRRLDVDAMNAAADHLLGQHDFASFCKKREGATTIRTLRELTSTRIEEHGHGLIETTVRADAFCHSMVRSLMGALIAVGEGRCEPQWASGLVLGPGRDPRVTVMPAHGLTLEEVIYPPDHLLVARAEEARRRRDES